MRVGAVKASLLTVWSSLGLGLRVRDNPAEEKSDSNAQDSEDLHVGR